MCVVGGGCLDIFVLPSIVSPLLLGDILLQTEILLQRLNPNKPDIFFKVEADDQEV